MSFTKIARAEARSIRDAKLYDQLIYEGWCESGVVVEILEDLEIPHEVMSEGSAYVPGSQIYAPAWVFGVWYNAGMPISPSHSRWDIVRTLLTTTKASRDEQRLVTAELAMEAGIPVSARRAAQNFIEVLRGDRKSQEDDNGDS